MSNSKECVFNYIVLDLEESPVPISTCEPLHVGEFIKTGLGKKQEDQKSYQVVAIEHWQGIELRKTPRNKVEYQHYHAGTFVKVQPA